MATSKWKSRGGVDIGVALMLLAVVIYILSFLPGYLRNQDLKNRLATQRPYSAEYAALAAKAEVASDVSLIEAGLYHSRQAIPKAGTHSVALSTLLLDGVGSGSFQLDLTVKVDETDPDSKVFVGRVTGFYRQLAGTLSFSHLEGDVGLIPLQDELIVRKVNASGFEMLDSDEDDDPQPDSTGKNKTPTVEVWRR